MKNLGIQTGNSRTKSTLFKERSCLKTGIWEGLNFELSGLIEVYRVNFPEISSYLCGREAESFDSLAKDHIFVVPNLVLIGLNCILNHHVA